MPGALNYAEFAGVGPGEQVLLAASTEADPLVVQAILAAVAAKGASPTVCYVPPTKGYFSEPPPPLAEAMAAADTILDVGAFVVGHTEACLRALFEYASKGIILCPPPTPAVLKSKGARFPAEVHHVISKLVFAQCQKPDGSLIHVTSAAGTDITAEVWRSKCGHGAAEMGVAAPGDFWVFPGGCFGFLPPRNVNGTAVFEAFTGYGRTSEPTVFTIRDSLIVDIQGGWEVAAIHQRIDGVKNGNWICEIMFGLNPANDVDMSVTPLSLQAERSPQTLHIGLGDGTLNVGPRRAQGHTRQWKVLHQDGFMLYPTLTVGGESVIERGRLAAIETEEVHRVAAKYGDPAEVLSYTPVRM